MSTISSTAIENPLKQLARFGQSIWLDYIRRSLMTSGELRRMVEEDGLGGMTSNPSIFEKAIAGGEEYADYLTQLRTDKSLDAKGIYERLAIRDIQDAADVLRPVYDEIEPARRLCEFGSGSVSGAQDAGDHRRSVAPVEGGGPSESDDQDSGDAGGRSGD